MINDVELLKRRRTTFIDFTIRRILSLNRKLHKNTCFSDFVVHLWHTPQMHYKVSKTCFCVSCNDFCMTSSWYIDMHVGYLRRARFVVEFKCSSSTSNWSRTDSRMYNTYCFLGTDSSTLQNIEIFRCF